MARLTLYFCDLCSNSQSTPLKYGLSLSIKGTRGLLKKGDLCEGCYGSLVKNIECEPQAPQANPIIPFNKSSRTSKDAATDIPLNDTELGLSKPALSIKDIRKINAEAPDDKCNHSNGFTMSEDGPLCKKCEEKVTI